MKGITRREFTKRTTIGSLGIKMSVNGIYGRDLHVEKGKRIGIIGLDGSHAVAFTKVINDPAASPEYSGYRVVAAYPKGSLDIESSVIRVPGYIRDMKNMGIEIVDSIEELLTKVDAVFMVTNDGRRHLEQSLPVFKAGKGCTLTSPWPHP